GELLGVPNPICPGDSSLFAIDMYSGIQWQESLEGDVWTDITGETSNQLMVVPETEMYYRSIVTDSVCVDISPIALIEIFEITNIEAGDDRTLREGYSIQLQATDGTDFTWSPVTGLNDPSISNPITSATESTMYYVTGTTLEGCSDTDSLLVTVTPKLGIPNTFTPNGDGVNDTWIIDSIDKYPNAQVDIYNRWGMQIFKSLAYSQPWDGRFNRQELGESTFYYVIDLKDGFPQLKGAITIIR
ncbi:MAG: gliding motility-associated C-terminal domain-containing protein, partial [Cyclobacteriaceae bacterium]|nr:gliding motility-associated C-terminal domain-containing protein [Cyclobacteriaceae bacterium]